MRPALGLVEWYRFVFLRNTLKIPTSYARQLKLPTQQFVRSLCNCVFHVCSCRLNHSSRKLVEISISAGFDLSCSYHHDPRSEPRGDNSTTPRAWQLNTLHVLTLAMRGGISNLRSAARLLHRACLRKRTRPAATNARPPKEFSDLDISMHMDATPSARK